MGSRRRRRGTGGSAALAAWSCSPPTARGVPRAINPTYVATRRSDSDQVALAERPDPLHRPVGAAIRETLLPAAGLPSASIHPQRRARTDDSSASSAVGEDGGRY